jgi:hypothetical protein
LAVTVAAGVACACARQPSIAVAPGAQSTTVGSIQLDIREATRLTQGVGGASVELVSEADKNWEHPLRRAVADSAGRAAIGELSPDRYAVRVWAIGHDTVTERISITVGHVQSLRVKLRNDQCTPVVTAHGPVCM